MGLTPRGLPTYGGLAPRLLTLLFQLQNFKQMKSNTKDLLYEDLAQIIEQGKKKVSAQINSTLTLVYWQVGHKISTHILQKERAEYAKEIVSQSATQLSWSHFIELLPLKKEEARIYYSVKAGEDLNSLQKVRYAKSLDDTFKKYI